MSLILEGVVGSTAYGMATSESDEDRLGIFVAPTREILGLHWHRDKETKHGTSPTFDYTYHEVGKYCGLALKGNPTILELMWLEDYTSEGDWGELLITLRRHFLSEPAIRNAYAGYAWQQIARLKRREEEGKDGFSSDTKKRKAKHARHCFRLLLQGRELLRTSNVRVRLTDDEIERLWWIGEQDTETLVKEFEREKDLFDNTESLVPERPNEQAVENFLLSVRREMW